MIGAFYVINTDVKIFSIGCFRTLGICIFNSCIYKDGLLP